MGGSLSVFQRTARAVPFDHGRRLDRPHALALAGRLDVAGVRRAGDRRWLDRSRPTDQPAEPECHRRSRRRVGSELSPVFGALLRRVRRDLPVAIARNYAGVLCVLLVTAGFVAVGLAKRPTITHDSAAMHDATVRAAAYIGDHAPTPYAANAARSDVLAIQEGSIYRVCVWNSRHSRDYCVIVNERLPFGRSVRPAGSEPNEALAQGGD
jgi:hypothetical protein